jgi:hypothetical protein
MPGRVTCLPRTSSRWPPIWLLLFDDTHAARERAAAEVE